MTEENKKKIATIFNNNLGNRITIELANGMLSAILSISTEQSVEISKEETRCPGTE